VQTNGAGLPLGKTNWMAPLGNAKMAAMSRRALPMNMSLRGVMRFLRVLLIVVFVSFVLLPQSEAVVLT
jgi:hypothetical protein